MRLIDRHKEARDKALVAALSDHQIQFEEQSQ
jgi:hypothetical protein